MNQIGNAISQGFSAQQILQYLMRHFPQQSKQIQKAIAKGYTAESILKYLGNGRKGVNEPEGELTEHEKARKSDKDKQKNLEKNVGKGALALGALGAGAYGLSRLSQAGTQALQGQLLPQLQQNTQNQPQNMLPNTQQQLPYNPPQLPQSPTPGPNIGMKIQQHAQQPVNQAMSNQAPNVPNPPDNMPAQQPQINFTDVVNQLGIKDNIDTLRRNNDPNTVVRSIRYLLKKNQIKEVEGQLNIPIESIVEGYLQENPQAGKIQQTPIETQSNERTEIEQPEIPESKQATGKGEKGWMVGLPDGSIGQIEDVKSQIARINVDGKIRTKKLHELIESPLPEKDMADLFEDVLSGIQKETGQEVSRNVYWAGYDPNTNELAYIPHLGSLYIYKDISPQDSQQLVSLLTQRKSTGQNHIGAWEKGTTSPIGAAMYQLIQKLQKERGGKGNEYSGKYQRIYDALEPAHQARKDKLKKQKDNEKPKRKTKKSGSD